MLTAATAAAATAAAATAAAPVARYRSDVDRLAGQLLARERTIERLRAGRDLALATVRSNEAKHAMDLAKLEDSVDRAELAVQAKDLLAVESEIKLMEALNQASAFRAEALQAKVGALRAEHQHHPQPNGAGSLSAKPALGAATSAPSKADFATPKPRSSGHNPKRGREPQPDSEQDSLHAESDASSSPEPKPRRKQPRPSSAAKKRTASPAAAAPAAASKSPKFDFKGLPPRPGGGPNLFEAFQKNPLKLKSSAP
jgi:hypothetical protein